MAGNSALTTSVVCCFCGESLTESRAARMAVCPAGAEDETQVLFCHARCLVRQLSPRVPHHPALDDDLPQQEPAS